ncbi:MAG TPA: phosphopantetheine-binding protein [Solirubrobacteraceae bacterium]|nr:phosphopantetheine-binding protein [Solirubrobacteraceae bacterium]
MTPSTITAEAIRSRVFAALEELGADPADLSLDAGFEALDVDSLDLVELGQIVHEEYGVELKGADIANLRTVGDAVALVAERAGA